MKPWQRFLVISSSSTLALALFPAPSKSQAIESFCAAAKENVSSDSRLSEAAKAVFAAQNFRHKMRIVSTLFKSCAMQVPTFFSQSATRRAKPAMDVLLVFQPML
jgi:hypothetical protein